MNQRMGRWSWAGVVLLTPIFSAGCAPSAQEWAAVDALPPGAARSAAQAELQQRQERADAWWDLAGMAGTLAGGFLPGAGLAVAALRRVRQAQTERDSHAAAARTLTGNLDQALVKLPEEVRRQTVEKIKQVQTAAGQRELIRAYLQTTAPAAAEEART